MIGVGATLNERFTLDKELGQGVRGTVFRATDQLLGRRVAIKLLNHFGTDEEADQIRLEAQILARMTHEKIVRLYDFSESEGHYFLVMEEVNGPSFSNRWRDLPLEDRLWICGQVAEALHYAHLQGLIHRDVKPGNVLLTANDEVKLSDFGISLVSGDPRAQRGTFWGTHSYMSPEQVQGMLLDHRTDLYSLGVMLYKCATGEVPFVGHAKSVSNQQICSTPPAPHFKNPRIWSTLESLILSLLEKNPAKRPSSGSVVALELFEEAERARRLDPITPGPKCSDSRSPVVPLAGMFGVGNLKADSTSSNGTGRVDPGTQVPFTTEPPPAALPPMSDTARPVPARPRDPVQRPGSCRTKALGPYDHPVACEMLTKVLATPIVVSPEERYLCGHYLAYLLGGSRRRGTFSRRPLDGRNSDRARLMLAMSWLSCVEPTEGAIERAGKLLDDRHDVRAALSPVVVIKYLTSRDTPAKRRRFRQIRGRLKKASAVARQTMVDADGVLNPGMMPATLKDLETFAPAFDTLDGHRVSLWNRATEVWRQEIEFRQAVIRYATRSDHLDEVSIDLWPEVVYALIERAHWQRTFRPRHEALWDYVVGNLLHIPVPGVRLDRMMVNTVPMDVADQLDDDLSTFVDEPRLDEGEAGSSENRVLDERRPIYVGGMIPRNEPTNDDDRRARRYPFYVGSKLPRHERPCDDDVPCVRVRVRLCPADPFLFNQNILRILWEGAMDAQGDSTRPHWLHRKIPVGQYDLAVIPTGGGRIRPAVRAVLQGMEQGKQIEIFTPSALTRDRIPRTVLAIWTYQDASMAVVHLDFQYKERYILWHAPAAHHFNFDHPEELRLRLSTLNLEVPDQLDRVFSNK